MRCPYKKECHHDAYQTLENELKKCVEHDISLPLQVSSECLDDGSGFANTLLKNEDKYHNGCRIPFRSHIVQRALDKRTRELLDSEEETMSPKQKKLSSFNASIDRKNVQCICCEKFQDDGGEKIYRAMSAHCGKKLYQWAT